MPVNIVSIVMQYLLTVLTVTRNLLCVSSLPFGFSDWFKIDEGSLQIEDGEVPCLPTGYKCDYTEECCDGMCVLSKLSKHRLCLVVGWKDELKLRDIYNHNPLRPEDVEYLRRTYNFSEDVSTKSPKKQIHVVYDEDVYDIPSLPDENKLFPITEDPFMYDAITTTQTTTTNSRTRNYSYLTRAYRLKNTTTSPEQTYRVKENYRNTLLSQNYTGFKKINVGKQKVNQFPSIRNYEGFVKYGLVNSDVERVSPQDTRRNLDNSLEETTEQNDFVKDDSEYNARTNSDNIHNKHIQIVAEKGYMPSPEVLSENFPDKNVAVITENTSNTDVLADTSLNLNNELTDKLVIKPAPTNLDDGLIVRSKNSWNISTENYKILPTIGIRQEELLASSLPNNITPTEISTTLTADLMTTTTEMLEIYNYYNDTQDVQVTLIPKAVSSESLIHDYKPDKPSDTDFSVASSIFSSSRKTILLTTEVENVTGASKKMNENISFRENLADSVAVNSTNGDIKQENEEITIENSRAFASSIPYVTDDLSTPNLDKVTTNYMGLNGDVISGYNDTDSTKIERTVTYIPYTIQTSTEFASPVSSVTDNLLMPVLDKVTKNYTTLNGDVVSGHNNTDSRNIDTTVAYISYTIQNSTVFASSISSVTGYLLTPILDKVAKNYTALNGDVNSGYNNTDSRNIDTTVAYIPYTIQNSTVFASSISSVTDNLLTPILDNVTTNYTALNGDVNSGYNDTNSSNIETTVAYIPYTIETSTEFASSISSITDDLLTPILDKVTTNYTALNGDVISGYTDTDSRNIETTVTCIPYVSDNTTLNYSRHTDNTLTVETSTLFTNKLRDITNNFTNINEIISIRDDAYSDVVKETTVKNFGDKNTDITGNYSTKFPNCPSTGVPSTFGYPTVHEGRKSKRGIWKKMKHGMGKVFRHKKGKHAEKAITEDYSDDSESNLLKFNIYKENKTTTRKKSKTKKLWKGLKKFFHKKHKKTDAGNISAARLRELHNSIEEKNQSGFVTSQNKHIIDDVKRRYENSFVLPLNKTKRRSFMSKVKGWFQFPQKKQKENTSINQNIDSRESKYFMQRTREKFSKVIGKYNKGIQDLENRTSKYSYHETITVLPAASENLERSTRSNLTQTNKRKFKLWSRIKRVLLRKNDGNATTSDIDKSRNDPAVINDFSIRELHTDLN